MIVMKAMVIDTNPAYEDGTPNAICIFGHPEPRSESGRPKLMKIRYITVNNNEPMLFSNYLERHCKTLYLISVVYPLYVERVFSTNAAVFNHVLVCRHFLLYRGEVVSGNGIKHGIS